MLESQWESRTDFDLPATRRAPSIARRLVTTTLQGWQLDSLVEDAQLIASELVTNALMHAPGPNSYELQLSRGSRGVRLALIDGCTTSPRIRVPDGDRVGGRGLRLIEALASRWGHEEHGRGKRVWADLDYPSPPQYTGIDADP